MCPVRAQATPGRYLGTKAGTLAFLAYRIGLMLLLGGMVGILAAITAGDIRVGIKP